MMWPGLDVRDESTLYNVDKLNRQQKEAFQFWVAIAVVLAGIAAFSLFTGLYVGMQVQEAIG